MRRLRFYILAAILLTAGACAEEQKSENKTLPEFKTFEYDVTTEEYSITVSYEQIANVSNNEAFMLIDQKNYNYTFGEFALDEPDPLLSAEWMMADFLEDVHFIGSFSNEELYCEMHLYQVASLVRNNSVVCYDTVLETNLGGAHPMVNHTYECYDLASGNIYDFSYLADGEWSDALGEIIYSKLKGEYGDAIKVSSATLSRLPEAIYLTDKGIVLQYQPYEIGDATLGSVSVEITDKELEEVGAPIVWE